jgi:ATPase subunit of ABC transporter with duplicated ATPase domains
VIASHDDALMAEYATRAFKIEPGKFADSAREQAHTYNKSSDKTQEQQTHARSGRSETLR